MNIKMPNRDERERSIHAIIEITVPAKRTLWGE
jgi:hypothetical protein